MTISLPLNLYYKPDWIGFAISAVFSSHKNPTAARMKQGSGFSHTVICHLTTNLGCMNPLLYYGIREEHVLTLLHQREFLWESIISHRLLSPEWSECTWVEFSFLSDNSDVSALKCAVKLVYRDNLENFILTMAPCITSYNNPFTSNGRSPFYLRDKSNDSDGLYEDQTNGTSGQYSYGGQHPRYQLYQTAVSDFFPSTPYNCCFPPSKIQDWFSHQNHGCSATMDLPSNLYHNSNWKGLVLYASFSIQGDSNFILSNLNSGKSHSLYCQCQMSMANVDDQTISFSTSKEEITWLLELGEFIWISYVPGEPFKNMLQHYSRIVASFVSDWPGVIVQNCALQLLYQHDQVQFEQELKHCNNLISENRKLVRKQQEDQKKRNEQYLVDEGLQRKISSNIGFEVKILPRLIDQPEIDETEIQLGQGDLLENQEKEDKRRVASKELTKIPREHLEKGPYDLLQKMDRKIIREESEEPGRRNKFWLHDDVVKVLKSNTANKLLCRYKFGEDFNPSTLYNCCFPPSKIQDWFSHRNHGCSATLDLPSTLYHNSNWMGLVLYASFSMQGDSNFILSNLNSGKSHSLYCQCQMSMANVDAQTIAFSTSKEEITWLLELGEFIWISYVPGEPFKNTSQLCSRIEASFMSDWPGVIVQNCALQLLYQHDQVQFEQELKHCNNLISQNREIIRKQQEDQKKRNEHYHVDEGLQNIDFEVKLLPRLIDQPETDETETELGQSDLLKEGEKNGGDNKVVPAPAPKEKKDDVSVTAVYKIKCPCQGCISRVERVVKRLHGVEELTIDIGASKLMVKGTNIDAMEITEELIRKTKGKVELVSPQPKKDGGGGDKKPKEKKAEKKKEPNTSKTSKKEG